jgi:hypothetical protein
MSFKVWNTPGGSRRKTAPIYSIARISNILAAYVALLRLVVRNADKRLSAIGVALNAALHMHGTMRLSDANDGDPVAIGVAESSLTAGIERFDRSVPPLAADAEAGSDDIERTLMTIWCKSLHLPRIKIDDDFFDVGGNSLSHFVDGRDRRAFRVKLQTSRFCVNRRSGSSHGAFAAGSSSAHPLFPFPAAGISRLCLLRDPTTASKTWRTLLVRSTAVSTRCLRASGGAAYFRKGAAPNCSRNGDAFCWSVIAVQNSGPYFLAGQCEGAIIAIEIANELRRLGRVYFADAIDTPVTRYFRTPLAQTFGQAWGAETSATGFSVFGVAHPAFWAAGPGHRRDNLDGNLECRCRLRQSHIRW